jgi:hypothetical protein
LYAGDRTTYKIALYLDIPLTDRTAVIMKLIEQSDDLYLFKLIADGHFDDVNILLKHFLSYLRETIARFLLGHCEYDKMDIETIRELLDEGKFDQAEDVANLFEAYQESLRDLLR